MDPTTLPDGRVARTPSPSADIIDTASGDDDSSSHASLQDAYIDQDALDRVLEDNDRASSFASTEPDYASTVSSHHEEQTPKENLNPDNILDAEGIKKISELTAREAIITNGIERDKQKTIRKQDVEAREAILELDRQQAEAEETQAREIAAISAREP